ncbi:MAG: hypothetical protein HOO06_03985 [Bdellovibrionaceae bacterium]|jgi:hypothetical protein|nr:hypothetical protein [Pseudobdellovibrionaceae bacterium]
MKLTGELKVLFNGLALLVLLMLYQNCDTGFKVNDTFSQRVNNGTSRNIPPVSGHRILKLTASETSGINNPNTKLRSGVPFPKGVLTQSESIALVTSESTLPLQTKILSLWGDNSIRWLLVDSTVDLAANEVKKMDLIKVAEKTPLSLDSINIQDSSAYLTVDTGPLKVEIPKFYGGVIHRAWINDQVVINAPTDVLDRGAYISVFNSGDSNTQHFYSSLLESTSVPSSDDPIQKYKDHVSESGRSNYNLYDPWNLEVKVEELGPLHSVIKISGAHLNSLGEGFSTFIVRLHFYAGEEQIKVDHTMVYTGNETQQVKSYGLKLPMAANGATTLVEGQISPQADGEVRHLEYANYEINQNLISGQALGYIGRSKNNVNMNIILRDMAEHFPKALVANASGLEVQLYPDSAQAAWDLTRYTLEAGDSEFSTETYPYLSQIATNQGETTGFTNHLFLRGAQGLSTTNEYSILFSTGTLDKADLENQAKFIDQGPVMLLASPQWYSDAKVMGVGSFAFESDVSTSEGHFRIDKILQIARDFMRYSQRIKDSWFGLENYGDVRGRFFGGQGDDHNWHKKGRYGWSGNSGEPSNQLWVQFLRSPSQQTFRDAEALARHTLDQQTVHFATSNAEGGTELDGRNLFNSVGSLHRHGVQAWSGYAGSPDYSHMGGVETYYYLSGDQRAREVIYEQGQFINRQNSDRTAIKNGLDVVDRAAAVFFDHPEIKTEFDNRTQDFLAYLDSDPDGFGYNAVEIRLIDSNHNGVHDRTEGRRTSRELLQGGFEYFMRGAPGLLYYYERHTDPVAGNLILDAANILTLGDPKADSPNINGDDWGLGVDGHAGSYFYHLNSLSFAAEIAPQLGQDNSQYLALTKLCIENNTHAGSDNNDTSPILLSTLLNLPDDYSNWVWEWQEDIEFNSASPGILWLDRMIMYQNNTIQDYHSYRAFIHLATAAANVKQGEMILR